MDSLWSFEFFQYKYIHMKRGVALSVATLFFILVLRMMSISSSSSSNNKNKKNMRILQVPRIQVIIITENDISLSMKLLCEDDMNILKK